MDRENSCEGMQLFVPKTKQNQSYLFWLPRTSLPRPRPCWITTLGRALQWDFSCSLPDYRHYSPPPTKCLQLCSARLGQAGLRPAPKQMAPDRMAACQSWICFPLLQSCVYGICAFVLRCFFFLFSHCTPQWSIVCFFFFFFFFPHVNAVFFFHSLSSCSVYPVVRCMLCMYEQVDG